jgi:cell division protein FtsW (lipid II flippase)
MKQWLNRLGFILMSTVMSLSLLAQDAKKVDVDIDVNKGNGSNWYAQPWVWIVGAAVFILLLIAILRGNSSRSDA